MSTKRSTQWSFMPMFEIEELPTLTNIHCPLDGGDPVYATPSRINTTKPVTTIFGLRPHLDFRLSRMLRANRGSSFSGWQSDPDATCRSERGRPGSTSHFQHRRQILRYRKRPQRRYISTTGIPVGTGQFLRTPHTRSSPTSASLVSQLRLAHWSTGNGAALPPSPPPLGCDECNAASVG